MYWKYTVALPTFLSLSLPQHRLPHRHLTATRFNSACLLCHSLSICPNPVISKRTTNKRPTSFWLSRYLTNPSPPQWGTDASVWKSFLSLVQPKLFFYCSLIRGCLQPPFSKVNGNFERFLYKTASFQMLLFLSPPVCIWLLPLFCVSCHLQAKKKKSSLDLGKTELCCKMHNFVVQIVLAKPTWKCAEEKIPVIFWTQNFKENNSAVLCAVLELSSSLTNEKTQVHCNAVTQRAGISHFYLYYNPQKYGNTPFRKEKKTKQLCGAHAVTYRSEELLLWISSCPGASWPP